jgi:hypothetical protein
MVMTVEQKLMHGKYTERITHTMLELSEMLKIKLRTETEFEGGLLKAKIFEVDPNHKTKFEVIRVDFDPAMNKCHFEIEVNSVPGTERYTNASKARSLMYELSQKPILEWFLFRKEKKLIHSVQNKIIDALSKEGGVLLLANHNAVVVFGDTDLNRSRLRADLGAESNASVYILLGTAREQNAMQEVLLKKRATSRIITTEFSTTTKGNMKSLKKALENENITDAGEVKLLLITHKPHKKRLERTYVPKYLQMADVKVEYSTLPEKSPRRILEQKILGLTDRSQDRLTLIVDAVGKLREKSKGAIEK